MNRNFAFGLPCLRTGAVLACLGLAGHALAGTPGVYTQYPEPNRPGVAGYNASAPRAIGKLFTNSGTCSASVISPNNIIVTAAHCCWNRSTNAWIGGWTFVPAYHDGMGTSFPWVSARVLNSWVVNGDTPSDICLIKLGPAGGLNVSTHAGWLGRVWDLPGSVYNYHALGYPGNVGNGQRLQLCTAESFAQPSTGCGAGPVQNIGCNMTYGVSGGPWIAQYRTRNFVHSVVHGWQSTACTGAFGSNFNGPKFTSNNIVPLCSASGC